MRHSIFIKSYPKDEPWLKWCLKFLSKYWRTPSELVIMAPNLMMENIENSWISGRSNFPWEYKFRPMDEWPNGYVGQQYFKMMADLYCSGEFITYFDSDAMLLKPLGLGDLLSGGAYPKVYATPYSKVGDAQCWRPVVQDMFGETADFEYMRRLPVTHHRSAIIACRIFLEDRFQRPLRDIMQPMQRFSEFNVLGHFCFTRMRDYYHWMNTEQVDIEPPWVEQFWSHGGLSAERETQFAGELERVLPKDYLVEL